MRIKQGVRLSLLKPQMVLAAIIIDQVFDSKGYECVITSGEEGYHKEKSKHYTGEALDFRINFITDYNEIKQIQEECSMILGSNYDVIISTNCLHVEYDP